MKKLMLMLVLLLIPMTAAAHYWHRWSIHIENLLDSGINIDVDGNDWTIPAHYGFDFWDDGTPYHRFDIHFGDWSQRRWHYTVNPGWRGKLDLTEDGDFNLFSE